MDIQLVLIHLLTNQLLPRLQYQWEYAMTKKAVLGQMTKKAVNTVSASVNSVIPSTSDVESGFGFEIVL